MVIAGHMRDEALPLQRACDDRGETRPAVPTIWNDKALDRARSDVIVEQLRCRLARRLGIGEDIVVRGKIDTARRLPA